MAGIDPYSLCPCGSGQKFKWCCHKVEAFADRSERLMESGQFELALAPLEEGLKKVPDNPWLLLRKALVLRNLDRVDDAKKAVGDALKKSPKHFGAVWMMSQLHVASGDALAASELLQSTLPQLSPGQRATCLPIFRLVAAGLARAGHYTAGIKHFRHAITIAGEDNATDVGALRRTCQQANSNFWLTNDDQLSPASADAPDDVKAKFEKALELAGTGAWSAAAQEFEGLSSDPVVGASADRNAGLCRLWTAKNSEAVSAFKRYVDRVPVTEEAVDVEALLQLITPARPDDLVEHVELSWPLRDREALIKALQADPAIADEGVSSEDPEDPEAAEFHEFNLLSTKPPADPSSLHYQDLPALLGTLYVQEDVVLLEAFDDGRLDRLCERFTSLAGPSIVPAHPKTTVLATIPRSTIATSWQSYLPNDTDDATGERMMSEFGTATMQNVWPELPLAELGGRTPVQAAKAGNAERALRALVLRHERSPQIWTRTFDFKAFRDRLNIPEEPAVEPEKFDAETLHSSRLHLVRLEGLSDEQLSDYYSRAQLANDAGSVERAARVLIGRVDFSLQNPQLNPLIVYRDLIRLLLSTRRIGEARQLIDQGRRSFPPNLQRLSAAIWDMLELRASIMEKEPEEWVPELAVILERHGQDTISREVM
ncbi:MAG: hypothetical protein U0835_27560, partial [Isosphaeraceae bacterium]